MKNLRWDLGDIVGGFGSLMKLIKGELTVNIKGLPTKSCTPQALKTQRLTDLEKLLSPEIL